VKAVWRIPADVMGRICEKRYVFCLEWRSYEQCDWYGWKRWADKCIDDYCSVCLEHSAGLPRVPFEMLRIAAKYDRVT